MRRCVFLSLILLFGAIQPLHAQDDNLPPVLEPEDILASSDLVVTKQPIVNFDDETHTLYYFDPVADRWLEYSYPEEMEVQYPSEVTSRSDGIYLINTGTWSYDFLDRIEYLWLFDPARGIYKPEEMCGTARSLLGEGYWKAVGDDETYLCNTETGQMLPPVPAERGCSSVRDIPVELSPDGDRVVIICRSEPLTVYSYDIASDTYINLGTSERGNQYARIQDWVSNTRAVIRTYSEATNFYSEHYFVVDADQPDNLEYIQGGNGTFPMYTDDPLRLEWIPSVYTMWDDEDLSTDLHVYDFATRTLTLYPSVGGVTGPSFPLLDGTEDRLYRRVNDLKANSLIGTSATLVRFNYETREWQEILTDEVEWIDSVSPNGRYAVLYMGRNHEVPSDRALTEGSVGFEPPFRLVVYDLNERRIAYEAIPFGNSYSSGPIINPFNNHFGTFPGHNHLNLNWIDGNTFLMWGLDEGRTALIRLDDGIELVAEWTGVGTSLSFDSRWLLLESGGDQSSVYDLQTGETIPLVDAPDYHPDIWWMGNNTLRLTVWQVPGMLALWFVDLPQ